jgi:hypothetical protein
MTYFAASGLASTLVPDALRAAIPQQQQKRWTKERASSPRRKSRASNPPRQNVKPCWNPEQAALVQRLDAARSILVARRTMARWPWRNRWFRGQITRNLWQPEQASRASTGLAAVTAAGTREA